MRFLDLSKKFPDLIHQNKWVFLMKKICPFNEQLKQWFLERDGRGQTSSDRIPTLRSFLIKLPFLPILSSCSKIVWVSLHISDIWTTNTRNMCAFVTKGSRCLSRWLVRPTLRTNLKRNSAFFAKSLVVEHLAPSKVLLLESFFHFYNSSSRLYCQGALPKRKTIIFP